MEKGRENHRSRFSSLPARIQSTAFRPGFPLSHASHASFNRRSAALPALLRAKAPEQSAGAESAAFSLAKERRVTRCGAESPLSVAAVDLIGRSACDRRRMASGFRLTALGFPRLTSGDIRRHPASFLSPSLRVISFCRGYATYKPPCRSVGPSVGPSVRRSVGPSVRHTLLFSHFWAF